MSDLIVISQWVQFQQQHIKAALITRTEYSLLIKTGFQLEKNESHQLAKNVKFC